MTDSIYDKLTPVETPPYNPAVGATLSPDQVKVVDVLTSALRDHGLIITPDQLVTKPTPAPAPPSPKPPLTRGEATLLGRCQGFLIDALKAHGITLSSNESKWVGALLADFVQGEVTAAGSAPVASLLDAAAPAPAVRKIG